MTDSKLKYCGEKALDRLYNQKKISRAQYLKHMARISSARHAKTVKRKGPPKKHGKGPAWTRSKIKKQMQNRLKKGLDPLTGEKMETKGMITRNNKGILTDATGREVTLNSRGTWIYKK